MSISLIFYPIAYQVAMKELMPTDELRSLTAATVENYQSIFSYVVPIESLLFLLSNRFFKIYSSLKI